MPQHETSCACVRPRANAWREKSKVSQSGFKPEPHGLRFYGVIAPTRSGGVGLKIHRFKLSISNAYLIQGERPILVDTGSPSDFERLRAKLREQQVEFRDLGLIVHTHIHSDHMGCTARIAAESDCPIAYHPADQSNADRSHNGTLTGIGLRGRIMKRFFSNLDRKSTRLNSSH